MAKYGRAAILEMVVNKLPEMAGAIAKPLESIDKVTIIDGGGAGTGVESMGGYVPAVLAKTIESIKETTGIDINEEECLKHPYKPHTLRHYTGALTDIRPANTEFYF